MPAIGITVGATITDPTGAAYANGTYTFTLVLGQSSINQGTNQSTATQTGALNGSGAFSGVLLGDTSLLGGGCRWLAVIQAANGQSFSTLLDINSATTSLSATLSAVAPLLTSPVAGNLTPSAAGAGLTLGTAALPWTSAYLGAAATDNFEIVGTAGQATVLTVPDPGAASDTFALLGLQQTLTNKVLVGVKQPIIAVASTLTLTAAQSGSLVLMGATGGEVVTLPAPAVGLWYNFVITVSNTSNSNEIRTDGSSHFLLGEVAHSATGIAALTFWADGSSIQAIKMDGAHLGGLIGSHFHVKCISTTQWEISGTNLGTATMTTAFNATP